jgi:hypothetical protein
VSDIPLTRWKATDQIRDLTVKTEALTEALQAEQAESLRQAEIARDALAQVERLRARLPSPDDVRRALRVIERAEGTGDVDAWDYQGVKDVLRAALPKEGGDE